MYRHIPVMLQEAIEYLNPQPGEMIADCTLGGGGYTFEISKRVGPKGRVIALDLDEAAINHTKLKATREGISNIITVQANFRDLEEVLESSEEQSFEGLDAVVFDLGLSSAQLEDEARGFSFQKDAPLSMAFGSLVQDKRTESIVNETAVSDLAAIIREFGEERYANSIARSIGKIRREKAIVTTKELVDAISQGVPGAYRRSRIHFATRTFQALRIATNEELDNLRIALERLPRILKPNARIVVISFHSLEDRIVKQFFRTEAKDCICPPQVPLCVCGHHAWLELLTKKALVPTAAEIQENPRSRSAKLRAARVISSFIINQK